ncbi:sensor histidine kinase [Pseudonocardia endophytica]|uniref:histidine kinase n=1 Tax=Pseudonocardia endophytica TaxID=401976 RepID=A0A4R1HLS8_PSEEN|nr:PAS domain-containing sensor histidine kinase [Pseudonocardia endophytica]TCK20589.1 two-component sensor histidine kinase [Pseudonocardia endophytica]
MTTLSELLAEHTRMEGETVDHLQRVVAEWQLLADMSFADFLLWVPLDDRSTPDGAVPLSRPADGSFLCVAQARPTTAPTAHPDDVVGRRAAAIEVGQLRRAVVEGRICRDDDPRWHLEVPVRRETIPVRRAGRTVAVLSRDTNLSTPRVPSPLEIAYLGSASDLCQMIVDGTFPPVVPQATTEGSPRAGDGLVRLDAHGNVAYASPNALSAYHRMGHASDVAGTELAVVTKRLVLDPFDAAEVATKITDALEGKPSARMEIRGRRASMLVRALPLRPRGDPAGALVIVRDVTDLRRRDMALLSKDATIREIHHRVKNNLQTVAALLRMQSRRSSNPEAGRALEESVRRVNSIALVHEALAYSVAETVELDALLDRVLPAIRDGATTEVRARVRVEGGFGTLPAQHATPLVLVLTELVHNALAHAYEPGQTGEVVVSAKRSAGSLDVTIADDGRGLPDDFDVETANGLGLQIVRTLLTSELEASLRMRARPGGGTEALIRMPLGGATNGSG